MTRSTLPSTARTAVEGDGGDGARGITTDARAACASVRGVLGKAAPMMLDDGPARSDGGCGRAHSSRGPPRPAARLRSDAAASASTSASGVRNAQKIGPTAPTVVCCSMISRQPHSIGIGASRRVPPARADRGDADRTRPRRAVASVGVDGCGASACSTSACDSDCHYTLDMAWTGSTSTSAP